MGKAITLMINLLAEATDLKVLHLQSILLLSLTDKYGRLVDKTTRSGMDALRVLITKDVPIGSYNAWAEISALSCPLLKDGKYVTPTWRLGIAESYVAKGWLAPASTSESCGYGLGLWFEVRPKRIYSRKPRKYVFRPV